MKIFSFREDDLVKHPCIITPFFVVHAAAGFWLASLIITFFPSLKKQTLIWVILLHTLYEIKDFYVAYVINSNNIYANNSLLNSIGDTIAAILGYYIYKQAPLSFVWSTIIYIIIGVIVRTLFNE